MRWICLAMFLLYTAASAEIYRCEIGGRTTFRDKPCQSPEPRPARPVDAMTGCYRVDAPGWESGRNVFDLKIVAKGGGMFEWTEPARTNASPAIKMRRASPEDLRLAREKLHFPATDGMVMTVSKQTPNQPPVPIGLYKGKDEYLDTVYFFFGFLANGLAKRITCP